jgi:hypothetical protein
VLKCDFAVRSSSVVGKYQRRGRGGYICSTESANKSDDLPALLRLQPKHGANGRSADEEDLHLIIHRGHM